MSISGRPILLTVSALSAFALALPAAAASSPPAQVAQAGYTVNTFSSNFTSATVDVKNTKIRGFNWYLLDLYGYQVDPSVVVLNGDGSVTLNGDRHQMFGALMSAVQYRGTNSYVGTAIGGGAYFEAEFKYDPASVAAAHEHHAGEWPAFWGLPMEGDILANKSQWPGQAPGFVHSVETDFFEADYFAKPGSYGIAVHDWYGIPNKTCRPGLCVVQMEKSGERTPPAGTDFTQYHRYGFLWVPATASSKGHVQAFFDGEPLGTSQSWSLYQNEPPPPSNQSWAFGRLDQQHQFMILGTGVNQPFTIRAVHVWQKGASGNMVD